MMQSVGLGLGAGIVGVFIGIIFTIFLNTRHNSTYQPNSTFTEHEIPKVIHCGICNEIMGKEDETEIFTLQCKHKFHKECLKMVFDEELKQKRSCPQINCRIIVPEGTVARLFSTI